MQREIKFRFWDTTNNKFDTDIGIYNDGNLGDFSECFHNNSGKNGQYYVVQQYTGLKDKNSKEIYEGDIIHYYNDDSYTITDEVLVCKYSPNNAWFTFNENSDEEDNGYYWLEIRNLCEVIGNIFENPDLIK